MKKIFILTFLCFKLMGSAAQQLAPTPPMGWMSWNFFADKLTENDIRSMADGMVSTGMVKAGYCYIMIDDGWQGGRDNKNNIIPDPQKFPSGIKALADYVHSKGIKLGIYSDAAPLTCAGYTGSLDFESQDARTFASWGIDYFKYDYCHAPVDSATAKVRYAKMAEALRTSDRDIVFSICEWGDRQPWKWAAKAGGQLWRTTADIRDKWEKRPQESWGSGIMDNFYVNSQLADYAGPGYWNDPDMLVVGLYGKKGPSGDGGGTGCTDTEYQSQMSLWSMMAAPLIATNDIRNMSGETKRILLNPEVIAIDQDKLGKQARVLIKNDTWEVLLKPLNGAYAVAILNRTDKVQKSNLSFNQLGLNGRYTIRDVWAHQVAGKANKWTGVVKSHETKLFRLEQHK